MSRARYVVSNHGAGLTNMLFMKDGARVLELRHVSDYVNNCYFILASALQFDYLYQLCEPKPDQCGSTHSGPHRRPARAGKKPGALNRKVNPTFDLAGCGEECERGAAYE